MISARDLVQRHGEREVLRGLTLEVARGEIAAVIGPSGGGKSTFLRCLNGLDRFQAGEVTVGDLRLGPEVDARRDADLLRRVRRRIGFVFQQFHLFPHRTVLGNVIEAPMHVLGHPRDRAVDHAKALLERVGLGAELDRYPRHISGGQQQRVAIARALAMEPEALLLDEPTSALDPVMAGEVLAVLADLARAGQTMIVVTHAMHFARQVASRVHVFAEGRVVESGPPETVLETPQHAVTRAFLEETRR